MQKEIGKLKKFLWREYKRIDSYIDLAEAIGLPLMTLHAIMNGKRSGSVETWEKIEKYYRRVRK